MTSLTVVCLLAVLSAAACRPEFYTDKYDNINIDEIIGNRRLLVPYVNCVLEQGKCSPEGKELKEHIADALETKCAKCTEKQQTGIRKVIKHLINHEPELWKQLSAKYDPDNKYTHKYEEELKTL